MPMVEHHISYTPLIYCIRSVRERGTFANIGCIDSAEVHTERLIQLQRIREAEMGQQLLLDLRSEVCLDRNAIRFPVV